MATCPKCGRKLPLKLFLSRRWRAPDLTCEACGTPLRPSARSLKLWLRAYMVLLVVWAAGTWLSLVALAPVTMNDRLTVVLVALATWLAAGNALKVLLVRFEPVGRP